MGYKPGPIDGWPGKKTMTAFHHFCDVYMIERQPFSHYIYRIMAKIYEGFK